MEIKIEVNVLYFLSASMYCTVDPAQDSLLQETNAMIYIKHVLQVLPWTSKSSLEWIVDPKKVKKEN